MQRLFENASAEFELDSDDETAKQLDRDAAIKNYDDTLGRIDNYLRAEMKILSAWQ